MFKKDDDKGIKAFLSEDVNFEGKFIFKGTANLDCKFTGEIYSSEGTLMVGEKSEIRGKIEVKNLINKGRIEGIVKCDKLENFTPGKIIGKIFTNELFIQIGALFDGECSMLKGSISKSEDEEAFTDAESPKILKKFN